MTFSEEMSPQTRAAYYALGYFLGSMIYIYPLYSSVIAKNDAISSTCTQGGVQLYTWLFIISVVVFSFFGLVAIVFVSILYFENNNYCLSVCIDSGDGWACNSGCIRFVLIPLKLIFNIVICAIGLHTLSNSTGCSQIDKSWAISLIFLNLIMAGCVIYHIIAGKKAAEKD